MALLQTYELHLTDGEGRERFEPLLCFEHELLGKAREALRTHGGEAVEVRFKGEVLLKLRA